jgi:hypothetical protein
VRNRGKNSGEPENGQNRLTRARRKKKGGRLNIASSHSQSVRRLVVLKMLPDIRKVVYVSHNVPERSQRTPKRIQAEK